MAGMIGTGKTTVAELLSQALDTETFYESVGDNPILPDYYVDPKRWAFPLQIYFLNTRFKTIRQAMSHENNVLDRSLYEDLIFAELNYEAGNMTKLEFETYSDLLETMMEEVGAGNRRPDLLIYLDSDLQTALHRIKQRGRDYEQIDLHPELLHYYTTLHGKYREWIAHYNKTPVLVINSDQFDIYNEQDANELVALVKSTLEELQLATV
ncbi:deoxynucleoside kinase [Fictibacillus macauensis]|nr:deoxynucleoside kinase [Fictibacillus macauensis]